MKKLFIVAWFVFLLGIIFKIFHIPSSNYLLLIGLILQLIHSVIFLIKNVKKETPLALLYLSTTFWSYYLFTRITFISGFFWFAGIPITFIVPLILTILCIVFHLISHKRFGIAQGLTIIYFLFNIFLLYVRYDEMYYFVHLNEVVNQESRKINYLGWDKYSWYLYHSQKVNEALSANENAQNAAQANLNLNPDRETIAELKRIKAHRELIVQKKWVDLFE